MTDDQTVLVRRHRGHVPVAYHTRTEDGTAACETDGNYREMPEWYAEHITREGRLCKRCQGDTGGGNNYEDIECPLCGADISNHSLAYHITGGCGDGDEEVSA